MRTLLTICTICLLIGCPAGEMQTPAEGSTVEVRTEEIRLQAVPEIAEVVGTVRPRIEAAVSAKIIAVVEKVNVNAGDSVKAGQVLAELDRRELQAEFDRAKEDFDRFRKLLDKQAATKAEFEAVQSRYRVAEASLSYATITAPFDGVVAQKRVELGDLTAPGNVLFVIETTRNRLEAAVPERFVSLATVGQGVRVRMDATRETCTGKIGEILPVADTATRSFTVKIDLDCQQPLKSGMFGRAQLPVGQREAVLIPARLVEHRGQLTYVLIASDGRAQMRLVKPGRRYGAAVEILAGLEPGDKLIVHSVGALADGQPIQDQ